jgi:HTH-type transcriptional regulator / antitoxin HipB
MITNQYQYRQTKTQLRKFQEAIANLQKRPLGKTDAIMRQAEINAMHSTCEDLQTEITTFDNLKNNSQLEFSTDNLEQLPLGLVQARIARGLTQEQLAKRLGVPKQQVQRDEETLYTSASLHRLAKVANVLGVRIETKFANA